MKEDGGFVGLRGIAYIIDLVSEGCPGHRGHGCLTQHRLCVLVEVGGTDSSTAV